MAGIDNLHIKKNRIKAVYNYLTDIDVEFQAFSGISIFSFVYMYNNIDFDNLKESDDYTIPVARFPEIVDHWLLRREDLLDDIADALKINYTEETIEKFKSTPIEDKPYVYAKKFKLSCRNGWYAKKRKYIIDSHFVACYDGDYPCRYYKNINKWESIGESRVDCLGYTGHIGVVIMNAKSEKALMRKIRKLGIPSGMTIKVEEFIMRGEIVIKAK